MKRTLVLGLALLLSLCAVSSASAQDAPPDPAAEPAAAPSQEPALAPSQEPALAPVAAPAPVPVAAAPAPVVEAPGEAKSVMDARRDRDASVDRNILLSGAETIGEGNFSFNSYQLIFAGFTYGITDEIQGTLTTLLPVVAGMPFMLLASGKLKLIETDELIVSVQPELTIMTFEGVTVGAVGGGVTADYRLDDAGKAVLTGGLLTHLAFGKKGKFQGMADAASFLLSAGFSYEVGSYVKLLTEMVLPAGYIWAGDLNEFEVFEQALLFNYGVRFFGENLAVDLTFLRPIHPDVSNDITKILPMGYPYLTFSAKF